MVLLGNQACKLAKTQANKQRYYGCLMTSQSDTQGLVGSKGSMKYRGAVRRHMMQIIHRLIYCVYRWRVQPSRLSPRLCLAVTIQLHHTGVLLGSIKACWCSALIAVWGNVYPPASYCMASTLRGGWDLLTFNNNTTWWLKIFCVWLDPERWVWALAGIGCRPSGLLLDVAVSGFSFVVIIYVMVRPWLILRRVILHLFMLVTLITVYNTGCWNLFITLYFTYCSVLHVFT